jgi:hypothetical protein
MGACKQPKYKHGDTVRVVIELNANGEPSNPNQWPGWDADMRKTVGLIGTVTMDAKGQGGAMVRFDGTSAWWYRDEWLELALTIKAGEFYRTHDGHKARVYAIDGCGNQPVHGAIYVGCEWIPMAWTTTGQHTTARPSVNDLVEPWREPHPAESWAVDTKIRVRDDGNDEWIHRHFAMYKDGKVHTFPCGLSSWTSDGTTVAWDQAELAE